MKVSLRNVLDCRYEVDNPVSHAIGGFGNTREDSLVLAFNLVRVVVERHPLEDAVRLYEAAQTIDARVEVVLDGAEVAAVFGRDLGRDNAPGDLIHVVSSHVERTDDCVQGVVDALNDLAIVALVLAGIGAVGQIACDGAFNEGGSVGCQRSNGIHHLDQAVIDLRKLRLRFAGEVVCLRDFRFTLRSPFAI